MTAVVVDASVWVTSVDEKDVAQARCQEFFAVAVRHGVAIVVPTLARIEVSCTLARLLRDEASACEIAEQLFSAPIKEVPIDQTVAAEAIRIGTVARLRGADASYAAVAALMGATLVTLDRELIERAGGITPSQWLAREGTG